MTIDAVSDNNTHCLLRSSIGQYIICLPPRLIVASLYLFLLWLLLWFIELLSGPIRIVVTLGVLLMFFQVVIPLSAFGRLIIHTGAMAKKRVIDEELEKDLLPSGLHASLLIRATDRRRKYTSAVQQYRKKKMLAKSQADAYHDDYSQGSTAHTRSHPFSLPPPSPNHRRHDSGSLDADAENQILATVSMLNGSAPSSHHSRGGGQPGFHSNGMHGNSNNNGNMNGYGMNYGANMQTPTPARRPPTGKKKGHRRITSNDSAEFNFPRASILNSASSLALQDVVERTLQSVHDHDFDDDDNNHDHYGGGNNNNNNYAPGDEDEHSNLRGSAIIESQMPHHHHNHPPEISIPPPTTTSAGSRLSFASPLGFSALTPSPRSRSRKSFLGLANKRQSSTRRVVAEWEEEEAVRCDYNIAPPADIIEETELSIETLQSPSPQLSRRLRASVLNRSWGLSSLRELVHTETMGSPTSSVAEESEEEDDDNDDDDGGGTHNHNTNNGNYNHNHNQNNNHYGMNGHQNYHTTSNTTNGNGNQQAMNGASSHQNGTTTTTTTNQETSRLLQPSSNGASYS